MFAWFCQKWGGGPLNKSPSLESLVRLWSLENILLKLVHRSGYLRWPNIQMLALRKHLKIHRYVWKPQTSGSKTKRVHQYFPPLQCHCLTNCRNYSPKDLYPTHFPSPFHPPPPLPRSFLDMGWGCISDTLGPSSWHFISTKSIHSSKPHFLFAEWAWTTSHPMSQPWIPTAYGIVQGFMTE